MRHPHPTATPHQQDVHCRSADDRIYAGYARGLTGCDDHVRRLWENQSTRFALAPAMEALVRQAREAGRGLRILEVDCGFAAGWNLLRRIPVGSPPCTQLLLDAEDIACYRGIGTAAGSAELEQVRARFAGLAQASFAPGDPAEPESLLGDSAGYDLYLAGLGAVGRLDQDRLRGLVAAMAGHQSGPCVLLLELGGRHHPGSGPGWGWEAASLRALLLGIPDVRARLTRLTFADRAILVGRGPGQEGGQPLRLAVNELFEHNHAVAPGDLVAGPPAPTGDPEVDRFLTSFHRGWDALVEWFARVVGHDHRAAPEPCALTAAQGDVPASLRSGLESLAAQAGSCAWFTPGDPLANLLQPQFGFLLRQYELHRQRGLGCGSGLLAVVELGSGPRHP